MNFCLSSLLANISPLYPEYRDMIHMHWYIILIGINNNVHVFQSHFSITINTERKFKQWLSTLEIQVRHKKVAAGLNIFNQ